MEWTVLGRPVRGTPEIWYAARRGTLRSKSRSNDILDGTFCACRVFGGNEAACIFFFRTYFGRCAGDHPGGAISVTEFAAGFGCSSGPAGASFTSDAAANFAYNAGSRDADSSYAAASWAEYCCARSGAWRHGFGRAGNRRGSRERHWAGSLGAGSRRAGVTQISGATDATRKRQSIV